MTNEQPPRPLRRFLNPAHFAAVRENRRQRCALLLGFILSIAIGCALMAAAIYLAIK